VGIKVLGLDPAFGLSGCRRSFDLGPTVLFTLAEAGVMEEGVGLRLYRAHTLCCFSKL